MGFIRNVLALIGLISLVAVGYAIYQFEPYLQQARQLDPGAREVYTRMARTILETGDTAEATVYKRRVQDGMTVDQVEEIMAFVANELNIRNVGELPMYQEVRNLTGQAFPFLKIYQYCDARIAAQMVTYSDAMAAYLPCRIVLREDEDGTLWLMTLDLNMMIHGGRPLPAELRRQAEFVRDSLTTIIDRAADNDMFGM